MDNQKNQNEQNQNASQNQSGSVKSSGKTVEEAINSGLNQLTLTREQVKVEILSAGSRGLFGLGAEKAVVLITPKTTSEELSSETPENDEEPQASAISEDEAPAENSAAASTEQFSTVDDVLDIDIAPEIQVRAKDILQELLNKMSISANVSLYVGANLVESDEKPPLVLDITGSDLGILIGRRGETLQSLQFVVRQILNKEAGHWVPIVVDVESYLVRRRQSLQQLAAKMAEKVVFSSRQIALEPMPAQDRRIIHLALRDHAQVYTNSIGDGDRRKVVILQKEA